MEPLSNASTDRSHAAAAAGLDFIKGRIRGVDHITIPVRDLATAERFYVGLLGAELVMRVDEALLTQVHGPLPPERRAELHGKTSPLHTTVRFGGGPRIDLFLQPAGRPASLAPHPHWAFAVSPDDIARLGAALNAAGVPTDGPRRLGPPGQASLYFNDPSGNHLEFATMGFDQPIPIGPPDLSRLEYEWTGAGSAQP